MITIFPPSEPVEINLELELNRLGYNAAEIAKVCTLNEMDLESWVVANLGKETVEMPTAPNPEDESTQAQDISRVLESIACKYFSVDH